MSNRNDKMGLEDLAVSTDVALDEVNEEGFVKQTLIYWNKA